MDLSRTPLLEFGQHVGGGSSGAKSTGATGVIPNIATSRIGFSMFGVDPAKEKARQEGVERRRNRLRNLVREWITTGSSNRPPQQG